MTCKKDKKNEKQSESTIEYDPNIRWKPHHETILIDWADKALCYTWLHGKSSAKYTFLRNLFTIPVIVMSTLTGTANFAIERIPVQFQPWYTICVGSVNIFAGLLTTIAQFLKLNELTEAHRVANISWNKFYRNICVELVKAPEERIHADLMVKICKDEFDRLMETSPLIDNRTIKKFNDTFAGTSLYKNREDIDKKKQMFKTLNKPQILDNLQSARFLLYKAPEASELFTSKTQKRIEEIDKKIQIDDFIKAFKNEYNRPPSNNEILNNNENLDFDFIEEYMSTKIINIETV